MKKICAVMILIAITATFVACAGAAIQPDGEFDWEEGVAVGEFREAIFTAASYNIKGGDASAESVKTVDKNLKSVGVNIAGLQEVDNLSARSGKKDFLGIFKQGNLNNVAYRPVMLKGFGDTYGLAEISETAFSKTDSFKLPYPYKYEKRSVEKRILMRSLVEIKGVQIAFYNTHLAYEEVKMPDGKSLRESQMRFILECLEKDPSPYKIVAGDFNALSFQEFDIFTQKGYAIVNNVDNKFDTYRGDDVRFKAIDNIIYSPRLQLISSGKYDSDCSDHDMLYATFKTLAQRV